MATPTLPRPLRTRAGATVALTALAAVGASWVAAPQAAAQGENGDIRVHSVGVPYGVTKDEPTVCRFYLDAVNFDILPNIAYIIQAQPPLPTAATVTGIIQLAGGAGHTDPIGLTDGQYKLTWVAAGAVKEKLFRVNCHDGHHEHDGHDGPNGQIEDHDHQDHQDHGDHRGDHDHDRQDGPGWGRRDDPPRGGVHAGGGGLIDTAAAYAPVAAAGAVGLIALGGTVYIRRNRRRPHGAA
ncbi:hypothetical protein [Streptomyces roseochromogenus]|uniref:Gram-positive cocci surface proteins LPxTG domain-containing protein n=1 Tax=Streptomyces roseochromogenus subsp. oscitans DS 12.976 TaxID=1352936 RepID=V6JYY3_STRRC|nr:hypothetical protein [Streptomyces roseochromogenus]EST21904.1 hypothetical protein M878_35920 [Streptomyces roseochromogenus subsp. oscitans DS 12.976]